MTGQKKGRERTGQVEQDERVLGKRERAGKKRTREKNRQKRRAERV